VASHFDLAILKHSRLNVHTPTTCGFRGMVIGGSGRS
jgi:hypothetical protein